MLKLIRIWNNGDSIGLHVIANSSTSKLFKPWDVCEFKQESKNRNGDRETVTTGLLRFLHQPFKVWNKIFP